MASVTKETLSSQPGAEPAPLPSGPAAAALLAGGIGTAWYGLLVVLNEASHGISSLLNFYKPVGPLSGKTTFGTIGFLVVWAILHNQWKGKDVKIEKIWPIALGLILLSLLFVFPPFFKLFAAE